MRIVLDLLASAGLICLIGIHWAAIEPKSEASKAVYETKMREYVLGHNLNEIREEAIDSRRGWMNDAQESSRRSVLTLAILFTLSGYAVWRVKARKEVS